MSRASRELAIAHLVQNPANGRLGDRDAELRPDPLDQIHQPPAHHPMDRRDRAVLDHLREDAPMRGLEQRRLAGSFPVDQATRPFSVEPDHPVTDDLKTYATELGGRGARAPSVDRRQRKEPPGLAGIPALAGETAETGASKSARSGMGIDMTNLLGSPLESHPRRPGNPRRGPQRVSISAGWY